jgi:phosphonate transport system substrate-binding protein
VPRLLAAAAALMLVAPPALADWRKDLGTFRIGLAASDASQLSPLDMEKIRAGFSAALGMETEITVLRDYPALIDAHASARIEYAVYSSLSYASAWLLCECVEPVVAPVMTNGATGVRSALIINAGAAFTRLDLNGIRIGMPSPDSATGYALPMAQYTLGTRNLSANEAFFKNLPDMTAVAGAFSAGQIDGFFGWAFADSKGPVAATGLMGTGSSSALILGGKSLDVKVPWTSELLRFGPHAIRRNIPAEAKTAIKAYFANMSEAEIDLLSLLPPADAAKFIPAGQSEYVTAISAAKASAEAAR